MILIGGKLNTLHLIKLDTFHETLLQWSNRWKATSKNFKLNFCLCQVLVNRFWRNFSWFFGHISRKEAEKLLLSQDLPRGAFLIRFAEHIPGGFSLTMRDYEVERGPHIKHYKIKCLDQGGYYVTTRQTFATLPELVSAYMRNGNFFHFIE